MTLVFKFSLLARTGEGGIKYVVPQMHLLLYGAPMLEACEELNVHTMHRGKHGWNNCY